jgi:plasmid maintenance system antidote protein VapI
METPTFWNPGEKTRVAQAAGLALRELTDLIGGRKNVSVARARKLEAATRTVLGDWRTVPAAAWLRLETHTAMEKAKEEACANHSSL